MGATLGSLGLTARAQTDAARTIPLEHFFRQPQLSSLTLSPDGAFVAGTRMHRGRSNLFVIDLRTRKPLTITDFADEDVGSPRWISNQRIIFSVFDRDKSVGHQWGTSGLFAIDRDATDFRELADRSWVSGDSRRLPVSTSVFAKGVDSTDDEILVAVGSDAGTRERLHVNIRRLNTRTARSTLLTMGAPGDTVAWVFDQAGVPRIAVIREPDGITRVMHRQGVDASWQEIARHRFDEPNQITPVAFDRDGALYVLARANGADFQAVHTFDLANKRVNPEPLVALKGYDLESSGLGSALRAGAPLVFDEAGRLIGVRYEADRSGTHWIDEGRDRLQRSLEATFPGHEVRFEGRVEDVKAPLLVAVDSDRQPTQYLLYRRDERDLQSLGSSRPWIRPEQMAHMETFRYKARDGLPIPATLTVPAGRERKNLPLVVLHYGGPWVRAIEWGFDPVVQFLASRGYAVLMPAPRASTGFGWKHFRSGWRQWGLAMQDDVTDGVQHLIAQGVVDAKRVCLAGASYGGYLTMMGLAKEPELFRCGINWVGVTDPELMYVRWTDFADSSWLDVGLPDLVGHPKRDAEQFARTSPVKLAGRIRQPVLLAYGGSDRRVPVINGERMRDALKGHNKQVEWVLYPDEGHGWRRMDNTLDFWGRVEKFLQQHLPA